MNVGNALVYFAPAEMKNLSFEDSPVKASGLVGNAPFYDDAVLIIDIPRGRMGVLRGK